MGPQGEPGLNGVSEWSEISNKPAWVADTQVSVNMSGLNNDLSLTVSDVEWTDVLNKPEFFRGSFNDLTDRPSIMHLTGPQGLHGDPGLNGASSWSDISDKPTWVTTSQASVNLSGFNNDLSLTGGHVEWADVLNKPEFFSGSYDDLTDRPTWVTTIQAGVSLSGFNNDLTAAIVEWADVLNKPELFSGSYNDLTGKPEWVRPSQGNVNLSEFNNDLGEELPGTIA
jgi:hypothetical protein